MRRQVVARIGSFKHGENAMERALKVGITGAGGNLGTTLVRGLRDKFDLKLFDRIALPDWKDIDCVKLDLADPAQLQGAFDGLDAIIHLAGNPSPAARRADTVRNNFVATSFVFEQAKNAKVSKIVFASSNFYHQRDIVTALRSEHPSLIRLDASPSPDCAYAESKVYGENLGFHYSCFGIDFVALRIGWTVPEDTPVPYDSPYMRAMFCSKRDLVQAFEKSLQSREKFLGAFVISNNDAKVFDLTETTSRLDFHPQDNAARFS
jgi:NAD+ dependent glucose-6-phosphate dehydrogenase